MISEGSPVKEETFTKIDVPTVRSKPTTTRARFRKVTSSTCRTYSLSEKYRILEGVGARNQLYMAEVWLCSVAGVFARS
ncbi:unnamed protein product [Cylicostephanus goldi]|uniref:Uncharacterized protein n=1 Tax=Cylicostephanus goldi TaxID=71465 RepID=A0A3P7N2G5_CYLGO|nr:unnamed protein product [Cylicostephanus goldi]